MTAQDDAEHIIGCLEDTRAAIENGNPELIEETIAPVGDHNCELCQGLDMYITTLGLALAVAPPDRQPQVREFLLGQIDDYIQNLQNAL